LQKVIHILLEIIGWLQIAVGVTLAASLIAWLVFLKKNDATGKIIAISIIITGFIAGVILATHIWRKYGTIAWLSGRNG